MPLYEWHNTLKQAHHLGAQELSISGGEPLIYSQLPKLVEIASKLGFIVNINSNGSLFTIKKSLALKNAGLSSVTISMPSINPQLLESSKRIPNLYKKIISSIAILQRQGLEIKLQTILSKLNYRDFDKIVSFAIKKHVDGFAVSYPEADFRVNKMLLNEKQITEFNSKIKPRVSKILKKSGLSNLEEVEKAINEIYAWPGFSAKKTEKGIFDCNRDCRVPFEFVIILQNGDVLPCNGIEYFHQPIIGNVLIRPLDKIIQGKKMQEFREKKSDNCKFCPINRNFRIALRLQNK